MKDIKKQIEELLMRKVKNCKNSTAILDTKDYVLLDDVIDDVSKILSQYVSDLWFVRNFEPSDISLSLEQGECKESIKSDDLNYWRKVNEDELPEIDVPVLCKFMFGSMQPSVQYRVSTLLKSGKFSGEMDWVSVIEWKPIN